MMVRKKYKENLIICEAGAPALRKHGLMAAHAY